MVASEVIAALTVLIEDVGDVEVGILDEEGIILGIDLVDHSDPEDDANGESVIYVQTIEQTLI